MSVDTESVDGLSYKVWTCEQCNNNKVRQRFYTVNDYHEHVRVKHNTEFVLQLALAVNGISKRKSQNES